MQNPLKLVYAPKRFFQKLEDYDEQNLNTISNIIAFIFGCVILIFSLITESELFTDIGNKWMFVAACFVALLFYTGLTLLLVNVVTTYLFHGIGLLLNSKAQVAHTRIVVVLSIVPTAMLIVVFSVLPETMQGLSLDILRTAIWLWSCVILVSGFRVFNKFGTMRAFINALPFVLLTAWSFWKMIV